MINAFKKHKPHLVTKRIAHRFMGARYYDEALFTENKVMGEFEFGQLLAIFREKAGRKWFLSN